MDYYRYRIGITLQPGESIPVHSNAVDVVFFIVEGIATFTTDTETGNLYPNDTIFVEQETNRGLVNNTDKIVRILVYKMK